MKVVVFLLGFLSTVAFATEIKPAYDGTFEIIPKVMHREAIKGTITVLMSGEDLSSIQMTTEKEVFGKTEFSSSEQTKVESDSKEQLFFVYKLNGANHKWYFVLLANNLKNGSPFDATYFKVKESLEKITEQAKAGIDVEKLPANWKNIGHGQLVEL